MKGKPSGRYPVASGCANTIVMASLIAVAGFASGCIDTFGIANWSDPRLTLEEFLELEEEVRVASEPATQPASQDLEAMRTMIDREMGPYRVGHNDVLTIALTEVSGLVGGQAAHPARVRIDRNGDIDMPIVGKIHVDGMVLEDIEDLITEAYVPKVYREAIVTVDIASVETTDVIVRGMVRLPGLIPLRRTDRNLLFALLSAGGATELSSGVVRLTRVRYPGEEKVINVLTAEGVQEALSMPPLEDGDIVTVESKEASGVLLSGLINMSSGATTTFVDIPPGKEGKSLLRVLAEAGGLRQDLYVREATLRRVLPDGREIAVRIDLIRTAAGKDPNITLQPGDILWVNHTFDTWWQQWFNSHVTLTAGASASWSYSAAGNDRLNHRDESPSASTPGSGFDPFGILQRGFLLNAQNAGLTTP